MDKERKLAKMLVTLDISILVECGYKLCFAEYVCPFQQSYSYYSCALHIKIWARKVCDAVQVCHCGVVGCRSHAQVCRW